MSKESDLEEGFDTFAQWAAKRDQQIMEMRKWSCAINRKQVFFFFQNTSHKNEQTDRHTTIPYIDKFTIMKFHALWFYVVHTWYDLHSCRILKLKVGFLLHRFYDKHRNKDNHLEFMTQVYGILFTAFKHGKMM